MSATAFPLAAAAGVGALSVGTAVARAAATSTVGRAVAARDGAWIGATVALPRGAVGVDTGVERVGVVGGTVGRDVCRGAAATGENGVAEGATGAVATASGCGTIRAANTENAMIPSGTSHTHARDEPFDDFARRAGTLAEYRFDPSVEPLAGCYKRFTFYSGQCSEA